MSEQATEQSAQLEALRKEANDLGITFSGNTGVQTLQDKIAARKEELEVEAAMEKEAAERAAMNAAKSSPVAAPDVIPVTEEGALDTPEARAIREENARKSASQLVRVIVTCNDPIKSSMETDFMSVGNSRVGNIEKAFYLGKAQHLPRIMINALLEKKYTQHITKKNARGTVSNVRRQVPAYNIQELPPLSESDLANLAKQQAIRNAADGNGVGEV